MVSIFEGPHWLYREKKDDIFERFLLGQRSSIPTYNLKP